MSLREGTRPGLGIIEPYLPSPAKAPGWLHEIKHDGIRIMARRDSAGVRLITRHGTDNAGRISPTGVGGARAASDSAGCLSPFPAAVDRRRARGLLHRQGSRRPGAAQPKPNVRKTLDTTGGGEAAQPR